jgi:hypothetical protein
MNAAVISPCGTYRYTLTRAIPCALQGVRPCLFVMLNPSVADANVDDPTIRRCIGFAKSWQCTSLTVVNLFALRATDPRSLKTHADPHGPDNVSHLLKQIMAHRIGVIVAAWGSNPMASPRAFESTDVLHMELRNAGAKCLGITKDGSPRHPLYVKSDQPLIPWIGTT